MRQKDSNEAREQAKKQSQENAENNMNMDINTDENMSGTTHLNEPVTDENELDRLQAELDEAKDKLVRKVAEFDNFRKRTLKERMELIQTASRDLVTDLLEVLDDAERAEKQLETATDVAEVTEGVKLVLGKLRNKLQARGLKPMETLKKEFDPELHEAITEIQAPAEDLKGKVVAEVSKGYYLNETIIRHAKVVVGK